MSKQKLDRPKVRNLPGRALTAAQATQVKAGGSSKKGKYMEVKMTEVIISNIQHGGSGDGHS